MSGEQLEQPVPVGYFYKLKHSHLVDYKIHAPYLLFFFFHAEHGIRDGTVTGVQTCALPISTTTASTSTARGSDRGSRSASTRCSWRRWRSEERRVGKECRSRWSPDY